MTELEPDPAESRSASDEALESPDDPARGAPFPVVGVGASAGGLEAFTQLLKRLPLDTGMGFVLVQHLDPAHESALTQILSRATSLPVTEIADQQPVEPDHVYIIPRDTNLSIEQGVLKLGPRPKTRTPHRPIDSFFESLALDQRDRAIGVVLSGTATDGTLGLEAIKAEGGITFAQDDSAKHDSMPRSAVAAGCVDLVLSPGEIADELARIARHPYVAGQPLEVSSTRSDERVDDERMAEPRGEDDRAEATAHEDDETPLPSGGPPRGPGARGSKAPGAAARKSRAEAARARAEGGPRAEEGYKKILLLLHGHSGVDFSLYKSTTIQRRITRRMVLTRHDTPTDYAGFLRGNSRELDALFSDVLISVTSFFRNPEMFDVLQRTVLPELLRQRSEDPLRCWVLGCSTGQEAYSLAISFVEAAENAPRVRKLQIFATDLNDALLEKARHGLYAKTLAEDITPERLRRFFVEEDGGYRVSKMLREMVVFARQNLIADPPFSRMDLISCRNLLIYLEPSLQKKALPTFHYALKAGGYLLLGASESIGGFTDLFEAVDRKHKIFTRKTAPTGAFQLPVARSQTARVPAGQGILPVHLPERSEPPESLRDELNAQRQADRITLSQFAPPGVLVNDELQIQQFRGPTGAFLEPPQGKASFDVLKMARDGLMLPLRATIEQARKEDRSARKENVRFKLDGKPRKVHIEVIPLKNLHERCYLILFEDAPKAGRAGARATAEEHLTPALTKKQEQSRIAELEADLAETREYFQLVQEQHEAANEELQAANEEVQSGNEELQSVNEELETSKEELESANEELSTVNDEMNSRNVELNRLNNDLVNLQTSTRLAVVVLGRDLTIRRFSPQAQTQFDLLGTDVGRPISSIRHGLVRPAGSAESGPGSEPAPADLAGVIAEVISSVREQESEVRDRSGRWYSLRVHPYMTLDNQVDGAVLVLVDIDALKQSEQSAAAARDYAESIIATVREPLLVLDNELRVESANNSFYRMFGVTPGATVGKLLYELGNRQWDILRLPELLSDVLQRTTTVEDFPVEHAFEGIGRKFMLLNARRMAYAAQTGERILLAIEDVTDRRHAEEASARLAAIVASSDDAIISKDLDGVITSWNMGAERLFGYSGQEIIGKSVTVLMPRDHVDEEPRILERIRRGESIEHYETVRRHKNGSLLDISLTVSPLKDADGRVIGASKIARDITERRRAEAALQASHASLQSHADELSRFNQAAIGRELRMIELKKEINALCERQGEAAPYALEFEEETAATAVPHERDAPS